MPLPLTSKSKQAASIIYRPCFGLVCDVVIIKLNTFNPLVVSAEIRPGTLFKLEPSGSNVVIVLKSEYTKLELTSNSSDLISNCSPATVTGNGIRVINISGENDDSEYVENCKSDSVATQLLVYITIVPLNSLLNLL